VAATQRLLLADNDNGEAFWCRTDPIVPWSSCGAAAAPSPCCSAWVCCFRCFRCAD